jgi:methyl-accepting chemotaxis protein
MSGDTIKEFLVGLGFDVQGEDKFNAAVGQATIVAVGLGAAAVAAAAGLFKLAEATAEYFDNLGDLSNRTGIAVADIEEFGYVAQLSGSSFETANASLEQFGKTAGDAANGMGRGKKVFDELGLSVEKSNGELKDTTDLLFELGDKIKDMDKGKQTAIAERLGIDRTLIEAITTDVGGLREEFRTLYAAAGIDSEKAAEKSGKFMDALDRFNFVLATVGRSLAINFMDRFTDALDSLRKMIVDNLPTIMRVLKPIITLVLNIADVFIALAYRASQAISVVIKWVADIVDRMDGWVVAIGLVVAAWKYLNLAFLATPIGAILALTVALGLLIDDFMTWQEGGESAVPWGDWAEEIGIVTDVFGVLRTVLENAFMTFFALVDSLVLLFSGDLTNAALAFGIAFDSLADSFELLFGSAISSVRDAFIEAFDSVSSYIQSIIDGVSSYITGAFDSVSSYIQGIIYGVSSYITGAFAGAFDSVSSYIQSTIDGVSSYISEAISSVIDGISESFNTSLDGVKNSFISTFDFIAEYVRGIISSITGFISGIGDSVAGIKDKLAQGAGWVGDAVSGVTGMFSSPEAGPTTQLGVDGGLQTSLPQPANQNVNQETNINVQAGPNAVETARAVGDQQTQVNGDMARNLKGAVR